VSVTDRNGDMVAAYPPTRFFNIADRDHFQVHAQERQCRCTSASHCSAGQRQVGHSDEPPHQPADGSFGGVVVASVDPSYFADFYRQVDLGAHGIVTIVGRDGFVRARLSGNETSAGQDARETELFGYLKSADHGSFESVSHLDNLMRIINYRALTDYPLVVMVGTARDEALGAFQERKHDYLVGAGAASAAVLAFSAWLWALLMREKRMHQSLAMSEARFRGLATLSADWYWEQDADYRFTLMSAGVDIRAGRRPEQFIGTLRWDNPRIRPLNMTWEQHRATLDERRAYRGLLVRHTDPQGNTDYTSIDGEADVQRRGHVRRLPRRGARRRPAGPSAAALDHAARRHAPAG